MRRICETFLRFLFFTIFARPIVYIVLGLNVRHKERLPRNGPAILVANHNSHLDTAVLVSLMPLRLLSKIRPAAAANYFLSDSLFAWFSRAIIGVVPVRSRKDGRQKEEDPLDGCFSVLRDGGILIFYPEGSRGEPEKMSEFHTGIARLAERYPNIPVVPVFLHGSGKSLPKGEMLLVPFVCDVGVGDPMFWSGNHRAFADNLKKSICALAEEFTLPLWE